MPQNSPNDRLSRLINTVCQVWEEEASETENKLMTLANRIISDNEHEKMRMQHSFKSMMEMKNNEIGALSQELRKLSYALEREAKENMENKRKIQALKAELDSLKGGGGEVIEDDVSSLHSASSTGGTSGPHPLLGTQLSNSSNGNRSPQSAHQGQLHDPSQQQQYQSGPPPNMYSSSRSPPSSYMHSVLQYQHPPPSQDFYPGRQHHQGNTISSQRPGQSDREGGLRDGIFHPQGDSNPPSNIFPPGQHSMPNMPQSWKDGFYGQDDNVKFGSSGNGNNREDGKSQSNQWENIDYGDREASLMSMIDDRDDNAGLRGNNSVQFSQLSLSDGPPGFNNNSIFQTKDNDMPPGFGTGTDSINDVPNNDDGEPTGNVDNGGMENNGGDDSPEKILNHIRLQSKSSKLDASPVGHR